MAKESVTYEQYNDWGRKYVENERAYYLGKSDPTKDYFRKILQDSIKEKILVDVGCGACDELEDYVRWGAAKVIGVEPSSVMREIAQERLTFAEIIDADFDSLPFPDGSVDIVTARYSLHILSNFEKAFEEVDRILKPNGIFLIAVSHPEFDRRLSEKRGQKVGERISIKLFGGEVVVNNATHTMADYCGDISQKYFKCEDIIEYSMNGIGTLTDLIVLYKKL